MSLYFLISISIALSLDAFGVAVSIGLNRGVMYNQKLIFSLSFGFFQFFFSLIGALIGVAFNTYVTSVPSIAGGVIVGIVGILMIKEGLSDKNEYFILNPRMYIILGISVSIDAMVIGFTVLNLLSIIDLVKVSIFIGLTALIVSIVGFLVSRYLKRIKIVRQYADYIGGIILILFGIKMIFS